MPSSPRPVGNLPRIAFPNMTIGFPVPGAGFHATLADIRFLYVQFETFVISFLQIPLATDNPLA